MQRNLVLPSGFFADKRKEVEAGNEMKQFQYEITKHSGEEFRKLMYACTGDGACSLDHIPVDQVGLLEGILNERGVQGWQLLQLIFRNEGIIAFWKKELDPDIITSDQDSLPHSGSGAKE